MKTTALLLLCFVFTANFCSGQNLVPNPSFEEYSSCPATDGEISSAQNWYSVNNTPTTSIHALQDMVGAQFLKTILAIEHLLQATVMLESLQDGHIRKE